MFVRPNTLKYGWESFTCIWEYQVHQTCSFHFCTHFLISVIESDRILTDFVLCRTRKYNTPQISAFIGFSVYNGLFLAVVILPLRLVLNNNETVSFVLQSVGFLFGSCFTLGTTLGIPVYNELFNSNRLQKIKLRSSSWISREESPPISPDSSRNLNGSTASIVTNLNSSAASIVTVNSTTQLVNKRN